MAKQHIGDPPWWAWPTPYGPGPLQVVQPMFMEQTKVKTLTVEVPVPRWGGEHTLVKVYENGDVIIKTGQLEPDPEPNINHPNNKYATVVGYEK